MTQSARSRRHAADAAGPSDAPRRPRAARCRRTMRCTATHGDDRCADDDDDMKVAALNALIHMDGDKARPILQKVLARRDAASVCLRRKAVFLDRAGRRAKAPRTSCWRPRAPTRIRRCGSRRCSGSRRWARDRAVGALDSILRLRPTGGSRTRRSSPSRSRTARSARQALRAYAERTDAPQDLREQAIFWIGQSGGKENADLSPRAVRPAQERGAAEEDPLLRLPDGRRGERQVAGLGVARDRTQPIEIRKQALFWAGQGGAPIADLDLALQRLRRPRDAGAADLRLLPARRDRRRWTSCWRSRERDPDPRAAEEGALLAGPERRSPRRQGAPGHHRATVRRSAHANHLVGRRCSLALLPAPLAAQSLAQRVARRRRRHRAAQLRRRGRASAAGAPAASRSWTTTTRRRVGERLRATARCGCRSGCGRPGRATPRLRRRALAARPRPGHRPRPRAGRGKPPMLLLGLAPQVDDDDGGELVTAATLADSAVVWPQLLRHGAGRRYPARTPGSRRCSGWARRRARRPPRASIPS